MRVNRRGKRGIIMLYKMLETTINAREVNGLAEKIEKLFNAGRLTESERNKLIERLTNLIKGV
jgi:hypothetical protein